MNDDFVEPIEEKGKMSTTTIVIIVIVALILLGCLCACLITFVIPAVMGPSIGNVFSDVMWELTP